MNQKYFKGTRVKVLIGHALWSNKNEVTDIRPELTEDIATVEYTYGEMSEIDSKYSKGEQGYRDYCLKFDKYGSIAWFDEDDIILL